MGITLANNAHTTLSADASSTDTVIYVEDIDSFPTLDVDDYFYCTLERTSGAMEIVKVTQINASSFNVERGQEGTIAITFPIGSLVELRITKQNLQDQINDIAAGYVDNTAYDATSWNGDTDTAPSKNAVRDKIEAIPGELVSDTAYGSGWNGVTSVAPSKNAVYDQMETKLASAAYTAADVLAKILTVDGAGSGLDADTLDGMNASAFLESGRINVKDSPYNAAGDGVTDDTSAFNAAMAAAIAGGKALYLPSGTYLKDSTTVTGNNITIYGDGKYLSVIKQKNNTNNYGFYLTGKSSVTFRDIGFDGNKANQTTVGSGIRVEGASNDLNVTRCRFFNWFQFGISLAGTGVNATITDNKFETAGSHNFITTGFTDSIFSGNVSLDATDDGAAFTGSSDRWTVQDNVCNDNGGGGIVSVSCNDISVGGNICWNNVDHGIQGNDSLNFNTSLNNCQGNGISGIDRTLSSTGTSTNDFCTDNSECGMECDSLSKVVVVGFRTLGDNAVCDIRVYETEAELIGCEGRIQVRHDGSPGTCDGTKIIGGGTRTGDSLTIDSGAATDMRVIGYSGTISDPGSCIVYSAGNTGLADTAVSDTAYNATTWNGVTTIAPSKNAVRDKFEALSTELISDTAYDATSWNSVTGVAPSKNAVRDKIEALAASSAQAADTTNTSNLLTPANLKDIGAARLLWYITGANLNSTADQAFTKVGTFTNHLLLTQRAVNPSGAASSAVGGIYTATGKGGTQIVANTQTYSNLTGTGTSQALTQTVAAGNIRSDSALYLSLTTPHGSAATADIYIFGYAL